VNVYTCTSFDGLWPVGTAAVIVAESKRAAKMLLEKELKRIKLDQKIDINTINEIDLTEAKAIIIK